MKHIKSQVITIMCAITFLSGCEKEPTMYEKCEATESAKWLANRPDLTEPQLELIADVLPILEKDAENYQRWTEYFDAETLWDEEYRAENGKERDDNYEKALAEAKLSFPHAEYLEPYDQAYDRLFELMGEAFSKEPDWETHCNSVSEQDEYCLSISDFYAAEIRSRFIRTEAEAKRIAAEICNTRGLYE
jgi:hypothetical protein